MPGTCVIGLQWGDEAKGKLVDLLTPQFDLVVRYQGGANAGHTVVIGDDVYKLHHVPSGILNPNVINVVTPGVVVNPPVLIGEIDDLQSRGIPVTENLKLSERAHVVFPWHLAEDRVMNAKNVSGEHIGTTLRGIGPCYRDKVGRNHAIRLGDMLKPDFAERVQVITDAKNDWLAAVKSTETLDAAEITAEYTAYADRLRPYIGDTTNFLLDAVEAGQDLLFEGAQGALLDIDHGTCPFVTSSNSSGVGVSAGSGVPGRWIQRVIGVIKSYSTRVGGGPFPTELNDEIGEQIRRHGNEFGTTTGRPRRCGWFDAVAVRYTARLSGVDLLAAMMLDVLSHFEEIQVCTAYSINGERVERFPGQVEDLRNARPIYETLPGWKEDVTGARSWDDLPAKAQAYVHRIEELIGVPVGVVSVGR
ncbi:MAG: adenylosuccinate synthase [Planctomycetota bacterium]